ncbi:hypothetical protein [Natronobeatus ordinarius]|uniref:hypothetical protein n=1 Tax=Natronobeatus ordinarius TaxID=2963433 RepID=UPI0020CF6AF2|nr:hypothetical protein [Natronobeatus ordinarius]
MSELPAELKAAFESQGYDVGSATENRDQLRVTILERGAPADELRSVVHDVVGEDRVRGMNVSTETLEGQDVVSTVVSVRYRS